MQASGIDVAGERRRIKERACDDSGGARILERAPGRVAAPHRSPRMVGVQGMDRLRSLPRARGTSRLVPVVMYLLMIAQLLHGAPWSAAHPAAPAAAASGPVARVHAAARALTRAGICRACDGDGVTRHKKQVGWRRGSGTRTPIHQAVEMPCRSCDASGLADIERIERLLLALHESCDQLAADDTRRAEALGAARAALSDLLAVNPDALTGQLNARLRHRLALMSDDGGEVVAMVATIARGGRPSDDGDTRSNERNGGADDAPRAGMAPTPAPPGPGPPLQSHAAIDRSMYGPRAAVGGVVSTDGRLVRHPVMAQAADESSSATAHTDSARPSSPPGAVVVTDGVRWRLIDPIIMPSPGEHLLLVVGRIGVITGTFTVEEVTLERAVIGGRATSAPPRTRAGARARWIPPGGQDV